MEQNKDETDTRTEKIKKHFQDNWKTYAIAAGIFAAGMLTHRVAFTRKMKSQDEISKAYHTWIGSHIKALVSVDKSHVEYQAISPYGNKLGRPGIPIYEMTTRKRYESESLAANHLGVSQARISDMLAGRRKHVNGYVFEYVY